MSFYLKDPLSRVDYAIDWAPGFLGEQEIVQSGWTVLPAEAGGIALDSASFTSTRAVATLTDGLAGHIYSVINQVTLSDGRIDRRSITLRVEER